MCSRVGLWKVYRAILLRELSDAIVQIAISQLHFVSLEESFLVTATCEVLPF